jgi:hypothetical protein
MVLGRTDLEQTLEAHPRLTPEAIQVALALSAEALRADVVYPIAAIEYGTTSVEF